MPPDLSQKQIHLQLFAAALQGVIANPSSSVEYKGFNGTLEVSMEVANDALIAFNERWKE